MKVFAIENHAMDCRVTMTDDGIVQTLNARMGTGGGNVPMVLIRQEHECYAVDNHPMDSRMRIVEGAVPSLTVKLAKLASDDPLVLVRKVIDESISRNYGGIVCEQPSGKLHRTGRVQQYASGDREEH